MPQVLTLPLPGTLGNNVGAAADGCLVGKLTPSAVAKCLRASHALAALCITDDGGLYADDTTDFGDADADDVNLLPATPAVDDAIYFGHATSKFERIDITIGVQGDGTWTLAWEYWDGAQWTALTNLTDGTSDFTAAAGLVSVTFDLPGDWAKNTVDNVLAYWVRASVATYSAVTTQPKATSGQLVASTVSPAWTDDTTDANDAGAGDVDLLPTTPAVGDALYVGYASKFCKVKVEISQERTGTATLVPEYWDGSAWQTLVTYDDDTVGFSATAGSYHLSFVPPSDWAANTAGNGPNGEAGYFVRWRLSALTSVTQQPQATQLWVLPLDAGTGIPMAATTTINKVTSQALTASGANADSVFLLINKTAGTFVAFTWTKATPVVFAAVSLALASAAELVLVQVTEDGTTEYADGALHLNAA